MALPALCLNRNVNRSVCKSFNPCFWLLCVLYNRRGRSESVRNKQGQERMAHTGIVYITAYTYSTGLEKFVFLSVSGAQLCLAPNTSSALVASFVVLLRLREHTCI